MAILLSLGQLTALARVCRDIKERNAGTVKNWLPEIRSGGRKMTTLAAAAGPPGPGVMSSGRALMVSPTLGPGRHDRPVGRLPAFVMAVSPARGAPTGARGRRHRHSGGPGGPRHYE